MNKQQAAKFDRARNLKPGLSPSLRLVLDFIACEICVTRSAEATENQHQLCSSAEFLASYSSAEHVVMVKTPRVYKTAGNALHYKTNKVVD